MQISLPYEFPSSVLPVQSTSNASHDWKLTTTSSTFTIPQCKCPQSTNNHRHCLFCNHTTRSTQRDYIRHIKTHIVKISNRKESCCPTCDKLVSEKSMKNHMRTCTQTISDNPVQSSTDNCPSSILAHVAVSKDVAFVRIQARGRPYGTHVDIKNEYCEHCSKKGIIDRCIHIESAKEISSSFDPIIIPDWSVDQAKHLKESEITRIKSNFKKCRSMCISPVQHIPCDAARPTFFSLSVVALFKDGTDSCMRISTTYDSIANKWTLSESSPHRLMYIAMCGIYLNYSGISIPNRTSHHSSLYI
jgi:hypothetical protein